MSTVIQQDRTPDLRRSTPAFEADLETPFTGLTTPETSATVLLKFQAGIHPLRHP